MMLGLAAGYSAGSAALHENTKVMDLVEIEERIIEASRFFDEWNHQLFDDPRVVMRVNDARNHPNLTPDSHYDLIVAEPSNPWLTGVSNLFTKEYFEMGKSKLKPDGIWSQWIQIYGMDTDISRSLLGTFPIPMHTSTCIRPSAMPSWAPTPPCNWTPRHCRPESMPTPRSRPTSSLSM